MRYSPARALIAPLALLAATAATQRDQRPTFRSGVELVQVDVVVVDADGRHVRGLTANDFVVSDRGKPQSIAAFEEISHERPDTAARVPATFPVRIDVANNQTSRSERLVVMVIDDLHIYKGRTDRAKELARQIVTQLGPQASMAVLFTSGNNSTHITEDRATLLDAVATLTGRHSWPRPHAAVDSHKGSANADAGLNQPLVQGGGSATSLQEFFENMRQYKTLQDAARMIGAGDVRRKAFVMISEGVGKDLTGLFDPGGITPCEAKCPTCTCFHDYALRDMMESLWRSSVTTYVIDPRGQVSSRQLAREEFPGEPSDPFRWYNVVRQAQDGLAIMAEASGGFAITDSDDFETGVLRVVQDLDHYYLLGFHPDDPGGRRYRRLEVTVPGHPDWRVRSRRGYQAAGPPAAPKNNNPLVALAAGVMPTTNLPLRLTAIPLATGGSTARVVLALEVTTPVRSLEDGDGRLRDDLKYEVLAINRKNNKARSVGLREGRLTLSPIRTDRPRPNDVTYQVGTTIELAPGAYQLRVSAMTRKLETGGSVFLDVDVPDSSRAPFILSGIALGYADGPRVATASLSSQLSSGRGRRIVEPGVPLPFPPTLDREFAASDTLRVYFEVWSKDSKGAPVQIELLDSEERLVRSIDPGNSGNGRRFDTLLPLKSLPPGAYLLRVRCGEGSQAATMERGLLIR